MEYKFELGKRYDKNKTLSLEEYLRINHRRISFPLFKGFMAYERL